MINNYLNNSFFQRPLSNNYYVGHLQKKKTFLTGSNINREYIPLYAAYDFTKMKELIVYNFTWYGVRLNKSSQYKTLYSHFLAGKDSLVLNPSGVRLLVQKGIIIDAEGLYPLVILMIPWRKLLNGELMVNEVSQLSEMKMLIDSSFLVDPTYKRIWSKFNKEVIPEFLEKKIDVIYTKDLRSQIFDPLPFPTFSTVSEYKNYADNLVKQLYNNESKKAREQLGENSREEVSVEA